MMESDDLIPGNGDNHPTDGLFNKNKQLIEKYSIAGIVCLILAVIFISFDLRLIAGILVIAGASLFVLVTRKSAGLINTVKESFNDASSSNVKKDDVMADFSHRITRAA